jgi:hypothetical protein
MAEELESGLEGRSAGCRRSIPAMIDLKAVRWGVVVLGERREISSISSVMGRGEEKARAAPLMGKVNGGDWITGGGASAVWA